MPWPAAFRIFSPEISRCLPKIAKKNEKRFETRQQEVSRSGCITLVGSFLSFAGLDFLDRSVHLLVPADHLYAMHSA